MKPDEFLFHPEVTFNCSPVVEGILHRQGARSFPLNATETTPSPDARLLLTAPASEHFPGARSPEGALSGLLLLLDDWSASHRVSQDLPTPEGNYWHAIAHRTEPDPFNAAYWFRRVGSHPIFPALHRHATAILEGDSAVPWRLERQWDPFLFIEWCNAARQSPNRSLEQVALAIQKAEWNLLFTWCGQTPP